MNDLKRNAAKGISTNDCSPLYGNGTFVVLRVYYKRWILRMIKFSKLSADNLSASDPGQRIRLHEQSYPESRAEMFSRRIR